MSAKKTKFKPVEIASVKVPVSGITPMMLSEILLKLGQNESVEIFKGGEIKFHRIENGKRVNIPLRNQLFLSLAPQDHIHPGRMVIPVDGSYNYADKHSATRKEANRNERCSKATFTGIAIQMALENPKPIIETVHLTKYWVFFLEGGTKVYTFPGNIDKILMIKRPGEDLQYNPD